MAVKLKKPTRTSAHTIVKLPRASGARSKMVQMKKQKLSKGMGGKSRLQKGKAGSRGKSIKI